MFKSFIALLALLLLYAGFVVAMRFVPPTPEQAVALRLLRTPTPPVEGRDGSDAAWLLQYDVPAKQRGEVARKYRDYLQGKAAAGDRFTGSNPLAAFAKFPEPPAEEAGVCKLAARGCLAYVRSNLDLVDQTMNEHRKGLDAALALTEHDGLRYGLRATLRTPFPQLKSQRLLAKTWFAYEFAAGRQAEALDGLCRDIAGWRRLGGNSDDLVASMVGVAYVEQDLVLLSELLEELSISASLPPSCEPALAEVADFELDLCPAIRNAFQPMESFEQELAAEYEANRSGPRPGLVDADNFRALIAPGYAHHCRADRVQPMRSDQRVLPLPKPSSLCTPLRKAADPHGCTLAEIAWPDHFEKYADRRTDQAAMLALMRTVVWLRTAVEKKEEVAEALARRPAQLGLRREPAYDVGASLISIPRLDRSRGEKFELIVRVGRPAKKRRSPVRALSGNRIAING